MLVHSPVLTTMASTSSSASSSFHTCMPFSLTLILFGVAFGRMCMSNLQTYLLAVLAVFVL